MSKPEDPVLILFAINHTLLHRKADGVKSNNNTMVRPGATELIEFLLSKENVYIVFYSNMIRNNAMKNTKFILNGSRTGMSIRDARILVIDSSFTTENRPNGDYYVIQDKNLVVNRSSYFFGKKFNPKKTVVIDYSGKNVEKNPDISIIIDAYDGTPDNSMKILKECFEQTFSEEYTDLAASIEEKINTARSSQ